MITNPRLLEEVGDLLSLPLQIDRLDTLGTKEGNLSKGILTVVNFVYDLLLVLTRDIIEIMSIYTYQKSIRSLSRNEVSYSILIAYL